MADQHSATVERSQSDKLFSSWQCIYMPPDDPVQMLLVLQHQMARANLTPLLAHAEDALTVLFYLTYLLLKRYL
jgi:hypothetical protein